MVKEKLDIQNQIDHLEKLGIKFDICTKDKAINFLESNNYLFKIKSYAKNYDRDAKSNKYINLDFAYLIELSTLDMYLRRIVLNIGLNIEHLLKVELNTHLSQNQQEDGYSVVEDFLTANSRINNEIKNKIEQKSFVQKLTLKNINNMPYWILIEILEFGNFLTFYKFYFDKHRNQTYLAYHALAYCVKFLRNGAAHNNCILNTLRIPCINGFKPNKYIQTEIAKIKTISSSTRNKILNDPTLHDILALIVLFTKICNSKNMKKATLIEINNFINRCKKHKNYFNDNNLLVSKFNNMRKIIFGLKYFK
ncbi:Abortive infection bacteriophage resistance protein [Campylobacter hyointestinalis subsp. hyointestinalis]|uniref:Abortive infection bacteriophage resistance protein n=1 Tax=Campylobacter hyointestinalis subsp. hyointestinalis TaxID=91352 RepID=A0A9W5AWG3_CAMHY|nr:Abi family protein [Campylobacter hyointestinalis]CUU88676.1 Abortive infection bacteriophage resistance protein [Campylobacter hyointestinalis subsp. hyointestinalis]